MSNEKQSMIGAVAFILGLALIGYMTVGFAGVLFSVAFVGGLILWLLTTYRMPIDPQTIIVPYLVTVILFIVHVYEEFATHVEHHLTQLSGLQVTQTDFLIIAAFSAPIVWLLGAVMLLKRWAFGYFFASTFLFGMMFAELSHFFSPLMEDGTFHYSPGMYTAILPVLSGWFTFSIILHEMKRKRSEIGPAGADALHGRADQ
jgi:hypothetical protein